MVLVRPEEMTIQPDNEAADSGMNSAGNRIAGMIELRTFLGPFTRFLVRVDEGTVLTADVPSQQARGYATGQGVVLSFPPDACQVLRLDAREVELAQLAEAEKV